MSQLSNPLPPAEPNYSKSQRKSRKPPAVKTAVIAKRAQGQNITSIAKDLGITRNTTRTIIQESDIDRQIQSGQLQSLDLIPEALRVARVRLGKDSETMAIEVLRQSIWPLNAKPGRAPDANLTIAIQNLMQVQAPQSVKQETVIDVVPDTNGQPASK